MGANNQPSQSEYDQYQRVSNSRPQSSNASFNAQRQQKIQIIKDKYPFVNEREWKVFLESTTGSDAMNLSDADFRKSILKHLSTQEKKYQSLADKMRQARLEQINQGSGIQPQDVNAGSEEMTGVIQFANVLSKIDRMKEFFITKEKNALQLQVHISSLLQAVKNILDNPNEDHLHYFTIEKKYTSHANNLSKLLILCGFNEVSNDQNEIVLYFENCEQKEKILLLRTVLSYLRQHYQQQIKPLQQLSLEVIQSGIPVVNNNNVSNNNNNQAKNQQEVPVSSISIAEQPTVVSSSNVQNIKNSIPSKIEEQVDVKIDAGSISHQIKEGVESRAVRERVIAQLEAKKRREQQQENLIKGASDIQQYQQKNNTKKYKQLSNNMQFEMLEMKSENSAEIQLAKICVTAINAHRLEHRRSQLIYDINLSLSCEFHSKYMAQNNMLGHQGFEGRSKEISQILPYSQLYELVASSAPADSYKVVEKWGNSLLHKDALLSDLTHVSVAVVLQLYSCLKVV